MYVNEVPKIVAGHKTTLFADDTFLIVMVAGDMSNSDLAKQILRCWSAFDVKFLGLVLEEPHRLLGQ